VAKISARSCWGISPKFSPRSKISGEQNLGAFLPGISPRLVAGSKTLGTIDRRNLGKIFVTLLQICFGVIAFLIKVKGSQCLCD